MSPVWSQIKPQAPLLVVLTRCISKMKNDMPHWHDLTKTRDIDRLHALHWCHTTCRRMGRTIRCADGALCVAHSLRGRPFLTCLESIQQTVAPPETRWSHRRDVRSLFHARQVTQVELQTSDESTEHIFKHLQTLLLHSLSILLYM